MDYSYHMIVAAFWAFWTAFLFGGFYLLRRLHRKFYVRRSDQRHLVNDGECYTPEQIRTAFRKTFASQMGPKVTAACNAFLLRLSESNDGEMK